MSKLKKIVLLAALAALLIGAVGGTMAFLKTGTASVENKFESGTASGEIQETLVERTKKDVKFVNTGDTDVYVRTNIVISWQNENGDVLAEVPVEGTDYTIMYHLDETDWFRGSDGFYYYQYPVAVGGTTEGSLLTCTSTVQNGEYSISVEILAQCIQAEPTTVVADAWNVTVASDGSISK